MAEPLTIGLRFERRDAPLLEALAERGRSEGLHTEQIGLFARAGDDARRGEPMRVICSNVEEARTMAAGFALYGVTVPAIEALSS